MKLLSPEHPNLWLPKHDVQFSNGEADVPPVKAKAILQESPHVQAAEDEPAPQPPRRQK